MNKCFFAGRLGQDPELRKTASGKSVANFSVGISDRDETKESLWINCVAWEGRAETIHQYIKKGDQIFLIGRMTVDVYEKDGKKNYKTIIVVEEFEFGQKSKQNITSDQYQVPAPKDNSKWGAKPQTMDGKPIPEDDDNPYF